MKKKMLYLIFDVNSYWDDFFQLFNWFQLFSSENCFPKVAALLSEQVKNDHFERGCRWFQLFLAHLAKGHLSFCHHVSSVVNFSHFNLLLRNHWANLDQTLTEWSLDGPLPKLCPVIPISNQDGRQAKNWEKRGGWNFNCPLLL